MKMIKSFFLTAVLALGALSVRAQSVELIIGDLDLDPAQFAAAGGCIQIPIYANDQASGTAIDSITFTLQITGDTGVVSGALSQGMIVPDAFLGTIAGAQPGIRNPAEDLTALFGAPTPACSFEYNQATEGQGPAMDFAPGANPSGFSWTVNNDFNSMAWKRGFASPPAGQFPMTTDGNNQLIGILEIPIIMGPAASQLIISAVPDFAGGAGDDLNSFTTAAGVADFVLPAGYEGVVNIVGTPDCSGATVADNQGPGNGVTISANYIDPMAGGFGGDITITANHDATATEIVVSGSDGYMGTFPAGGVSTMISLDTTNDGTPLPTNASTVYTMTPRFEFPPMSGTFVSGTPCMVTVNWANPTCSVVFDTLPVTGGSTNVDVMLSNVVFDGGNTRFALLTSTAANWGGDINLNAPTSVVGNVLTYDNAYSIASINAGDVGSYSVTNFAGPAGTVAPGCSTFLGLMCPTFNTQCDPGNINGGTPVQNGGVLTVTLDANDVATWDVTYNGVTDAGLAPAASPYAHSQAITALATTVTVQINGFDSAGAPCNDSVVCTLDFEAPTCSNLVQTPDTSVTPANPGDMITLTMDTTNALTVTYDDGTGPVAMTATGGAPETTYMNSWTATYSAFFPTTITVTVTNADGETTTCMTFIDVNCNASFVGGAPAVGTIGTLMIQGIGAVAPGLDYDIYYSDNCGLMPGDDLAGLATFAGTINLTGAGIVQGSGPAGHVIQPDVCYYVTCDGSTFILDALGQRTVPTLGEWGLMIFALLLMGGGVIYMRRGRQL
ncbi:MAG: IPTL-CTERM sorting domain-containing protein [Acidobacteria bacterium]|nr:IPTL-CTERM sorting domain-containing protein [Acidobacteriota bacterium]